MTLTRRIAVAADSALIADLVRRAYRGRDGWTTEADFLSDNRIEADGVLAKISAPGSTVLLFEDSGGLVACCEVVRLDDALAYFGMFAVEPTRQAGGIGRSVLAAAEEFARDHAARRMQMQVIGQRAELIAWYRRRGYEPTDERRPFHYDEVPPEQVHRDDLYFQVLEKPL